jgi:hypothetical protein
VGQPVQQLQTGRRQQLRSAATGRPPKDSMCNNAVQRNRRGVEVNASSKDCIFRTGHSEHA